MSGIRHSSMLVLAAFLATSAAMAQTAAPTAPRDVPVVERRATGFEATALVPADVSLFVHLDRAASLRSTLEGRPAGRFVASLLAEEPVGLAWTALADDLLMSEAMVFDRLVGRSATFVARPAPAAADGDTASLEWALLAVVDERDVQQLVRQLAPRILGGGWYALTRQQVQFAWRPPLLLVAPDRRQSLARDIDTLLDGGPGPRLSAAPEVVAARETPLEAGPAAPRIELVMRHDPPMGGCSVAAAAIDGERIVVRQSGTYEHAPFRHEPMGVAMDISVLGRFVDTALVAVVEPNDRTGTRRDPMMAAMLPGTARTAEERENLGTRRVFVVGEREGRVAPQPFDMAYPTMALAVEVRDVELATRQQDRLVAACVASISRQFMPDGRLPLDMPNLDRVPRTAVRSVELERVARELIGDHPLASTIGLHWRVVQGDDGAWQVFASDRGTLDTVVDDLAEPGPAAAAGEWEIAGTANGPRIAAHLRSWSPHARLFVAPEASADFQSALVRLADLAAGFDRIRWRVARPDEHRVRTEVELDLAAPETVPSPLPRLP